MLDRIRPMWFYTLQGMDNLIIYIAGKQILTCIATLSRHNGDPSRPAIQVNLHAGAGV